jgi:hypothetical protein
MECAGQSALWSVATCRGYRSPKSTKGLRRQAAEDQSGDWSPHSKRAFVYSHDLSKPQS